MKIYIITGTTLLATCDQARCIFDLS